MPRKPQRPKIACQYFTWRIMLRAGVYYADGRGGKFILGKYSLNTCNYDEALARLKELDLHKAVELGLIDHCHWTPGLMWMANVVVDLVHTGARIGELAGLRWSDIKLDLNQLTVPDERSSRRKRLAGTARTTKGRRSRSLPIQQELRSLLLGLDRTTDGYVFHAARGGRLHPRNVLQMFIDEVIEPLKAKFPAADGEIGFEHGWLHGFRHYFCSQAFLGGASEGEIKEWLGHADSKMVEHYRHLRSDDAQRKMANIEFLRRPDDPPGNGG